MAETTTSADKFEEFRKYATEGPWEMVSDDNGMLISRRSVPGTSLYTQRGITVINAPVLRVRALIENVEARPKWDSMVAKGEMVRRVDENHVLARFTTEAQWPVAAREFYVEVVAEVEPSGKQTILANTPADHEQEFPVTADYVRGVAQNSGYILEPVAGSEPEQTKIIFLTQRLSPSFLLALLLLLLLLAGLSPRFPFSQWTPRAGSRPPSSRLRLRATRCVSAPSRRCARIPTPSERPPFFFPHSPLLLLGARRANTQQLVSFLVPLILQAAIFSPSILILQKSHCCAVAAAASSSLAASSAAVASVVCAPAAAAARAATAPAGAAAGSANCAPMLARAARLVSSISRHSTESSCVSTAACPPRAPSICFSSGSSVPSAPACCSLSTCTSKKREECDTHSAWR